jgi:hypothetical protein
VTLLAMWLQLGGLVVGSVGALFLAIAQGRNPGDDVFEAGSALAQAGAGCAPFSRARGDALRALSLASIHELDAIALILEGSWYGERPPAVMFALLFVGWGAHSRYEPGLIAS